MRFKKEEVILEAFDALQEHISKDILPSFIYTYGVYFYYSHRESYSQKIFRMVFPVILQLQALPREFLPNIVLAGISEEGARQFMDKLKGFYFKPKHSIMLKFIPTEKYEKNFFGV